jgi:hypothetical protein
VRAPYTRLHLTAIALAHTGWSTSKRRPSSPIPIAHDLFCDRKARRIQDLLYSCHRFGSFITQALSVGDSLNLALRVE